MIIGRASFLGNYISILKYNLNTNVSFSNEKPYARFNNLPVNFFGNVPAITILINSNQSFTFTPNSIPGQKSILKIVSQEDIKGDSIYTSGKEIEITPKIQNSSISSLLQNFSTDKEIYIAFPHIQQLFGPINPNSYITEFYRDNFRNYFFVLPRLSQGKGNSLFLVENDPPLYFGVVNTDVLRAYLSNEYTKFIIRNCPFDLNRNYPVGSIVYGKRRTNENVTLVFKYRDTNFAETFSPTDSYKTVLNEIVKKHRNIKREKGSLVICEQDNNENEYLHPEDFRNALDLSTIQNGLEIKAISNHLI